MATESHVLKWTLALRIFKSQVEKELRIALDGATWHSREHKPRNLEQSALNGLASDFADAKFDKSPRLRNELLNRIKPSATRLLLRMLFLGKWSSMRDGSDWHQGISSRGRIVRIAT